jgi:hypothetical protein
MARLGFELDQVDFAAAGEHVLRFQMAALKRPAAERPRGQHRDAGGAA